MAADGADDADDDASHIRQFSFSSSQPAILSAESSLLTILPARISGYLLTVWRFLHARLRASVFCMTLPHYIEDRKVVPDDAMRRREAA